MGSFNKLQTILKTGDDFLLVAHEEPDGDCLGAMLALRGVIKSLGGQVEMLCKSVIPEPFLFLDDCNKIKKDTLLGDYQNIILIDNGDIRRTGLADRLMDILNQITLVNIDHHPKNNIWSIADINYVQSNVSSTCEMLYSIITGMGLDIDSKTATYLLTGIYTDTGGFKHSNTSPDTLFIVSSLLNKGGKLNLISNNIENYRAPTVLKLWGVALSRMKFDHKYSIVYSILTRDDLDQFRSSDQDVSGLINLINSLPSAKVALLLYETAGGKIKGSLRTENNGIDTSLLAQYLNGGGHRKASGFCVEGELKRIKDGWQVV